MAYAKRTLSSLYLNQPATIQEAYNTVRIRLEQMALNHTHDDYGPFTYTVEAFDPKDVGPWGGMKVPPYLHVTSFQTSHPDKDPEVVGDVRTATFHRDGAGWYVELMKGEYGFKTYQPLPLSDLTDEVTFWLYSGEQPNLNYFVHCTIVDEERM